jgi:PIN domain
MSAPGRGEEAGVVLAALPTLELDAGFWERAGLLRGGVLATGFKARLADAVIAQACIDHDVALITRDKDFRHFARHGLHVLPQFRIKQTRSVSRSVARWRCMIPASHASRARRPARRV